MNAIVTVQDWSKRRLLQPLVNISKTINGQAAHEEIKGYIVENEAVNTALVTRVLRLETRIRLLTVAGAVLAIAEALRWVLR
jgi:hypothetical protein